jgi:2-polyprenyl-3-methyl-5-hydroxy-6-metoxy-1,4-benzoquinol methylase
MMVSNLLRNARGYFLKWKYSLIDREKGGLASSQSPLEGVKSFCGTPCSRFVQFGDTVIRWHKMNVVPAVTCTHCAYVGFIPPSEAMLSDYYTKDYGKSSSSWYNLEADYAPDKVNPRADGTINLAKQYISYSSPVFLEIGCAFGGTVWELRKRGVEAYGSDLNSSAIFEGQRKGNSYIFDGSADQVLNTLEKKASLIYCYHALEHVPDPVSFLLKLKPCLSEEAILEFRVPNGAYIRAWLEGFEKWDWFAYPEHLHMFTPRSILCLAEQAGYEVLSISSGYCGESAESLINLIAAHPEFPQPDSAQLYARFLEEKMLMMELIFILCKRNSTTAELFRERINATTERCKSSENFELSLK